MPLINLARTLVSCAAALTLGCGGAQRAPAAAATSEPTAARASLAEDIDAYISGFGRHWGPAHAFSGYVVVARGGERVLSRGYGQASHADADTRFRLGSLTKQFTAVAVLQLAEQYKLRLDAPVRSYLPTLPESFQDIRLHHLLSHSSGIASYTDVPEIMAQQDRQHTPESVLESFVHKPLAFTPGERFAYSNSNYFLLGLVIEKQSGVSYESYLQTHVLGPAGMQRTSTLDAPDAPNTAVGYRVEDEQLVPAPPIDMSLPFAAGALRSTANDMLAWDRALSGDRLLSTASKKLLFKPNHGHYAYGFIIGHEQGHELQVHGGGIRGFSAFFVRVPDLDLQVVVLGNNESFEPAIGPAIAHMALTGQKLPAPAERPVRALPADLGSRVAGRYLLTDETRARIEQLVPAEVVASVAELTVVIEADRAYLAPSGQARAQLFQGDDGVLFTKRGNVQVSAEPPTGTAESLTLVQNGLQLHFTRKPE